LVRPLPALLAPLALGLVFALENLHPPRILYAEMWAAPFVVIAGAMCALGLVGARASGAESRGAWLPGVVGAGCAFAAMAIRELAALPAAWMLFSLVIDRRARARRAWMPWLVAVVAWACVYAWHASRVAAVSLADPFTADAVALSAYVHPGVAFLAACVRWAGTTAVVATVIALLAALAIAGLARLRDSGIAWLATGSTLGVVLLLVVAGTPGRFPDGSYTGYWGFLFVPLVVAWCPLGLRLLPGQAVAAPRERAHSRDRGR
ncbi:MAG: hypothetical protein HYR74_10370, partial [Candidatus Eisenbacteria bacterium]|nr:hypothetical protein [Candidatus Eisenbacteria bacterium]